MNTLVRSIETSFPLKDHRFFQPPRKLPRRRANISCKSDDSSSSKEPGPSSPSEGDTRRQEILAKIAMLQAQKVRLTDFLDERSDYLTQFAQEANTEFDQIGETALKGLDEAEARVGVALSPLKLSFLFHFTSFIPSTHIHSSRLEAFLHISRCCCSYSSDGAWSHIMDSWYSSSSSSGCGDDSCLSFYPLYFMAWLTKEPINAYSQQPCFSKAIHCSSYGP